MRWKQSGELEIKWPTVSVSFPTAESGRRRSTPGSIKSLRGNMADATRFQLTASTPESCSSLPFIMPYPTKIGLLMETVAALRGTPNREGLLCWRANTQTKGCAGARLFRHHRWQQAERQLPLSRCRRPGDIPAAGVPRLYRGKALLARGGVIGHQAYQLFTRYIQRNRPSEIFNVKYMIAV